MNIRKKQHAKLKKKMQSVSVRLPPFPHPYIPKLIFSSYGNQENINLYDEMLPSELRFVQPLTSIEPPSTVP